MHNLLFCPHTLCMSYVTNTFLLVSSSVGSKQLLCFVHCQGPKREQKPTTKNFCRVSQPFPSINYDGTYLYYTMLLKVTSSFACAKIVNKIINHTVYLNYYYAVLDDSKTVT